MKTKILKKLKRVNKNREQVRIAVLATWRQVSMFLTFLQAECTPMFWWGWTSSSMVLNQVILDSSNVDTGLTHLFRPVSSSRLVVSTRQLKCGDTVIFGLPLGLFEPGIRRTSSFDVNQLAEFWFMPSSDACDCVSLMTSYMLWMSLIGSLRRSHNRISNGTFSFSARHFDAVIILVVL